MMKMVDGREFECIKCGKCCKWSGFVFLEPEDVDRISKHLDISKDDFLEEYTERGQKGRVLKDKKDSKECMFLENDKCSIFKVKPKQCDDYPWEYDKRCPGFKEDEPEDRSATMAKNYEQVVKMVNEKLSSSDDYNKKVMENLYTDLHTNLKGTKLAARAVEEGIDSYLSNSTVKIASLDDIFSFDRVDKSHLIHKCTRDLWSIDKDKDGTVQIVRLFDNNGEPIKG